MEVATQPTWTDTKIEKLKKLWAEGLSATVIAGRIGGVSRNAVIGKVHRMGLPGRGQARGKRMDHGARAKKRSTRTRAAPARAERVTTIFRETIAAAAELRDLPDTTPDTAIAFADLEPHHCRWPYGDPRNGLQFCGCEKIAGISYCAKHAARAFSIPSLTRVPLQEIADKAETVLEVAE